jgi:phosphoadenosine phosphosulfate reductase
VCILLKEQTLFGVVDKVADSIQLLQDLEPPEGYWLAFSGGKDSITIKRLAEMAGVKYEAWYSVTTIDPTELVHFIRDYHPDVNWLRPDKAFVWRLAENGFPLRQARWCCAEYKERGGEGRVVITGIRAAESHKRAKRKMVELCYRGTGKRYVNPILTWTDDDVWNFIKKENLEYCKLYDEGWERIGCLFCPNAGTKRRLAEAEKYPGFTKLFIKAFERLYEAKHDKWNMDRWGSGEEMFWWWLGVNNDTEDADQAVMFE